MAESQEPFAPDGRERHVDPRSIVVRRLAGAIAMAVVAGLLLLAVVITLLSTAWPMALRAGLLAAWLLVSTGLTLLALLWPAWAWSHRFYAVDERGLAIRGGVLWRSIVIVPRSRVQHTDVSQGPLERAFELSTLIVYTAGTEHASVALSGLERQTAFAIRDHLIGSGSGRDDAV